MTAALTLLTIVLLALGYAFRDDAFVLSVAVGAAALPVPALTSRFVTFRRGFVWATLLTSSVWRYRTIRLSIAYLIAISVDGELLLVKGSRITTQYQPVGGVYKARPEGMARLLSLGALSDTRFVADAANHRDLRMTVPGKNLHRVLQWFDSGQQREMSPWREFFEELVRPGLLDRDTFAYFDYSYRGRRQLPFRFDKYSQHYQLIVGDMYEMHPSDEQLDALRKLREQVRGQPDAPVLFATPEQIRRGGATLAESAGYDIPPTAVWLLSS
jgi:hypothetical protein